MLHSNRWVLHSIQNILFIHRWKSFILIKSTFSNLPIYFSSHYFHYPLRWLWHGENSSMTSNGGISDEFNFHLINWATIFSLIKEEDLGIWNLKSFNNVLLCKWLWRYLNEWEVLWRFVIILRYGEFGRGYYSNKVSMPYGVGLWKRI